MRNFLFAVLILLVAKVAHAQEYVVGPGYENVQDYELSNSQFEINAIKIKSVATRYRKERDPFCWPSGDKYCDEYSYVPVRESEIEVVAVDAIFDNGVNDPEFPGKQGYTEFRLPVMQFTVEQIDRIRSVSNRYKSKILAKELLNIDLEKVTRTVQEPIYGNCESLENWPCEIIGYRDVLRNFWQLSIQNKN